MKIATNETAQTIAPTSAEKSAAFALSSAEKTINDIIDAPAIISPATHSPFDRSTIERFSFSLYGGFLKRRS